MEIKYQQLIKMIESSYIPLLIEFWASWCPPCKMMDSTLHILQKENLGKIEVVKINTDLNPKSKTEFDIRGLPTIILVKDKKEIKRTVGAQSIEQLRKFI